MNKEIKTDKENRLASFFNGKKVLVTGHTGFKGSWLIRTLLSFGACVCGYSLKPPTDPSLYSLAGLCGYIKNGQLISIEGDIRDLDRLFAAFDHFMPQIVFHLAAQPIVRDSYRNPVYTYETNVMGTVNVLECIRRIESVRSAVIITTDKVYKNNEWIWGYRESDPLDGFDPYSNSKSCAELAVHSYMNSFFSSMDGREGRRYLAVSTARAGNVIGGGDFANDRIIPDCVRAIGSAINERKTDAVINVRNPYSTRPYQHVLEPLAAYMMIASAQWNDRSIASCYNVGPDECDCVTTGVLADLFCNSWNNCRGKLPEASWISDAEMNAPHEASFLKLDSSKIRTTLGFFPGWHIRECIDKTVAFSQEYFRDPESLPQVMDEQIKEYFG